jgi:parallel beta-helix repeat protein
MLAMLIGLGALAAASSARATTGVMAVNGIMHLTEDHFGTLVMAPYSILFCDNHGVFNSPQYVSPQCDGVSCGIKILFADYARVEGCNISGHVTGIAVRSSARVTIRNNSIHDNTSAGIDMFDSAGSLNDLGISGNQVMNNRAEGLRLSFVSSTLFSANTSSRNGRDGFDVGNSTGNRFVSNTARENGINGMELDFCNNNSLSSNTVVSNGQNFEGNGLSLDSSHSNNIQGTSSQSNAKDGIRLQLSNSNTIQGSTVIGNFNDGIRLEDSNSNTIQSNTVTSNRNTGINVLDVDGDDDAINNQNKVLDNTSNSNGWTGPDGHGIRVKDARSTQILRNVTNTNFNDGLRLLNVDQSSINNNRGTGNGDTNPCPTTRGSDYHAGSKSNNNQLNGNSFPRSCFNAD